MRGAPGRSRGENGSLRVRRRANVLPGPVPTPTCPNHAHAHCPGRGGAPPAPNVPECTLCGVLRDARGEIGLQRVEPRGEGRAELSELVLGDRQRRRDRDPAPERAHQHAGLAAGLNQRPTASGVCANTRESRSTPARSPSPDRVAPTSGCSRTAPSAASRAPSSERPRSITSSRSSGPSAASAAAQQAGCPAKWPHGAASGPRPGRGRTAPRPVRRPAARRGAVRLR